MDNKYMGMKVLSLCILHLISIGEKETIATVEKEIEKGSLVTYLYNKYPNLQNHLLPDYIQVLNNCFAGFAGYVEGNEDRKYGICGEDNGLLLLLALVFDLP